jgi:hypothetical protein
MKDFPESFDSLNNSLQFHLAAGASLLAIFSLIEEMNGGAI